MGLLAWKTVFATQERVLSNGKAEQTVKEDQEDLERRCWAKVLLPVTELNPPVVPKVLLVTAQESFDSR